MGSVRCKYADVGRGRVVRGGTCVVNVESAPQVGMHKGRSAGVRAGSGGWVETDFFPGKEPRECARPPQRGQSKTDRPADTQVGRSLGGLRCAGWRAWAAGNVRLQGFGAGTGTDPSAGQVQVQWMLAARETWQAGWVSLGLVFWSRGRQQELAPEFPGIPESPFGGGFRGGWWWWQGSRPLGF